MLEKNLQHFDEQSPHNVDAGKCVMMMMENNFTLKTGAARRETWVERTHQPIRKLQRYCSRAVRALFKGEQKREKRENMIFMGAQKKGFVGHTSGNGYHNKMYTYITRDKNTFLFPRFSRVFSLESTTFHQHKLTALKRVF